MGLLKAQLKYVTYVVSIAYAVTHYLNSTLYDERPYLKGMLMLMKVTIGGLMHFHWLRKTIPLKQLQKLFFIHTLTIAWIYTLGIEKRIRSSDD